VETFGLMEIRRRWATSISEEDIFENVTLISRIEMLLEIFLYFCIKECFIYGIIWNYILVRDLTGQEGAATGAYSNSAMPMIQH
jgi:hypothetical protein